MEELIPIESIQSKIYIIRGKKVMLDRDLAELYQVETRVLNQLVKRNIKRFPNDFMFQFSLHEFQNLKSHFVTSSWGGVRKYPFAFTENGISMLSGVLNSDRAIMVNIQIMRTFTKMKAFIQSNINIYKKLKELETKYEQHDKEIGVIFEAIKQLMEPSEDSSSSGKQIGFIKS